MTTPIDPYNTPSRRNAEEEDLLAPIAPTPSAASAMEAEDFLEAISEDAAPTSGTDPAFDQKNYFSFTREIPATHLGENAHDHRDAQADVSVAHETSVEKESIEASSNTAAHSPVEGDESPRMRRSIFAQTAQENEEPSPYLPTQAVNDVAATTGTTAEAEPREASAPTFEASASELSAAVSAPTEPTAVDSSAAVLSSEPAAEEAPLRVPRHRHKKEESAVPAPALEDDPFAALVGAPIEPVEIPESHRGWVHVGVFLLSIVLIPSAWYVFSDAAAKISGGEASQWATGVLNTPALLEMLGAAAIGLLLALSVRASSIGAWFWGFVIISLGATALISPYTAKEYILKPLENAIGDYNSFTANVVDYLRADLSTGGIFIYGIALVLISFVAHSVRQRAMQEGELRGRALESQERSGAAKASAKGK